MTRTEIIDYVMSLIDEVTAEGLDNPVTNIERLLDKSTDFVIRTAPDQMVSSLSKLGGNHFTDGEMVQSRVIINQDGSGYYVLPVDFVRLISFKLDSWSRPIFDLINNKDPRYNLQKNRVRRGNKYQPIGALIPFAAYLDEEKRENVHNVNLAIEFFSTDDMRDTVSNFIYIPKTLAEDISENLLDPVSWECASRCLHVLRRYDEAKEASRRAELELNSFKLGEKGD
jgi:hypothetical protein